MIDNISPEDYIKDCFDKKVKIMLINGECYLGVLTAIDRHNNLTLANCEELGANGRPKRRYGDTFFRGNTILCISRN